MLLLRQAGLGIFSRISVWPRTKAVSRQVLRQPLSDYSFGVSLVHRFQMVLRQLLALFAEAVRPSISGQLLLILLPLCCLRANCRRRIDCR
jgi:hypothetical protein